MKNKYIVLLASVGAAALAGALIAKRKNAHDYTKEVEELFSLADSTSEKTFHYRQLEGLPEPVQRYFHYVLPDQYPYINTVRLTHGGQFKTGSNKAWSDIKGEQYFTTNPPGFIWRGQTALFSATDKYVADKGSLIVNVLSLVEVVNTEGSNVNQGELLRWLGESVWFPTNLLPSEQLNWSPIDENAARLSLEYDNLSLDYLVSFNDLGEITQMETQRYISEDTLETWVGEVFDYRTINGVKVPTRIQATWKLPEGDYTYANFRLKQIEYNVGEPF